MDKLELTDQFIELLSTMRECKKEVTEIVSDHDLKEQYKGEGLAFSTIIAMLKDKQFFYTMWNLYMEKKHD